MLPLKRPHMGNPSSYGLSHPEFRTHQEESINWCLDLNEPVGIIQAPTGSGKSTFPASAAHRFSATALCKTKALQQENYGGTYDFDVLYGRGNYPCTHPESEDGRMADMCLLSNRGMFRCPFAATCRYLMQKNLVRLSRRRSLNYFYWLAAIWPHLKDNHSEFLFMDECHELPDLVTDRAGVHITETVRHKWELPEFPDARDRSGLAGDYPDPQDQIMDWLEDSIPILKKRYSFLSNPERIKIKRYREQARRCEHLHDKLLYTIKAMQKGGAWFVLSGPLAGYNKSGRQVPTLTAKPLTARYHFPGYFLKYPRTILMSATVGDPGVLAEELGIKDYESRDVPSLWPPKSRPVFAVKGEPKIGHSSKSEDYAKQANIIAGWIQGVNPEWSGIIHVTRKTEAPLLAERLARRGLQDRVVPMPQLPTNQQMSWWAEHKKQVSNAIAITWSWAEGVDLGDEKICISAKVPFPSRADAFERARQKHNGKMYKQRTAWNLEQSLGRTRRGRPEDYDSDGEHRGLVAIVDGNWKQVQKYLSTTLREAIVEV